MKVARIHLWLIHVGEVYFDHMSQLSIESICKIDWTMRYNNRLEKTFSLFLATMLHNILFTIRLSIISWYNI